MTMVRLLDPSLTYYKARCSIDQLKFRKVPENFRLIPGMTLSADMNIGSRSVAAYLLGQVSCACRPGHARAVSLPGMLGVLDKIRTAAGKCRLATSRAGLKPTSASNI